MASTRDKRLKTDSPTPVAASETAATTPTTKAASTAIKLKRMSRNRSGILSAKSENEDGNDSVGLSEDTQSSTASVEPPKTPNTRTKRQPAKDEKEEEVVAESKEESPTAKDAAADSKRLTKAQLLKQRGAELAQARKDALLKKRNSLPLPVKSSTRNNSSLRLSSGAKVESAKEETQVTPKKGKPGRKPAEKKAEEAVELQEEDTEANDDAESVTEKSEDKIDDTNDGEAIPDVTIKQEKLDKSAAAIAIDLLNVRRSTRQRKSTIKDRDSPFTGRKSQVRDKSEAKRDSISPAISIKAEKESSKEITITVNETAVEKDPSLSPELVSEEMDTESVQHLYDKPDFLENNLGIEQDPKLGDIVKVQEKTKVVEVIKNEEVTVTEEETIVADDVEMKSVEEKPEEPKKEEIVEEKVEEKMETDEKVEDKIVEKVEKVNGEKTEIVEEEEAKIEVEEKPKPESEEEEEEEEEAKSEKDSSLKDEESSGEENKENNENQDKNENRLHLMESSFLK